MKILNSEQIIAIALESGLKMGEKAQPIFLEKFKKNIDEAQNSLDPSRIEIIARAYLAKRQTKKKTGTMLGFDSTEINTMLRYKPELGDPQPTPEKERWTAGELAEHPLYTSFRMNEDELEVMMDKYIKMKEFADEHRANLLKVQEGELTEHE